MNCNCIIEGEYAENEIRKDFTVSERVAIAEALEREMGNRQGQRTDVKSIKLPCTDTEVLKGKETRNIAAQKAGLGHGATYQQAKKVVNQGIDELKTAMDLDKISIKDATYSPSSVRYGHSFSSSVSSAVPL